jgi:NAD(P)-dependent dehydrogenase (short-subunit alcohol dehydrogenase family)
MRDLSGKVVVVTGASSGLGREASVQFAARGCAVVLAARDRDHLEAAARECREVGGRAHVVPTDVTSEAEVDALVSKVLAELGEIDVWVNNAGVTVFARLDEGPFDAHRRVIETNVIGSMLCARAVVPVFRRQKHGVLINVSSILGKVGQPYVPSYTISKFALRGLTETLRTSLADEPHIHVCSIFPYAIDTPHFQAAASEIERPAIALPPLQSTEKVARAIVSLAERPRRELHVPRTAALGLALHTIAPNTVEQLLLHALRRWHFADAWQPATEGALYEPSSAAGEAHGERGPKIGTIGMAFWSLRELVKIIAERTRRRARLLGERHA